jgi:outer membrane receptor protein involved in Fe transport
VFQSSWNLGTSEPRNPGTPEPRNLGTSDLWGGPVKYLASFVTAIFVSFAVCVPSARAQSVDTGILGTISDASAAIIPGAQVTVTNVSTGIVQSVVSGPNGAFEVRYLVPGEYIVEAKLSGFRTERRTVALRVAQMARLNLVLEVGDIGEVVDVVAQGLLLETQSGVTGNVVTADTIVNLPLSGRNFTALGNLTAGVVATGTQFRASGARGMYQQVSLDGVSALNNRGNNLFIYPSVDAIEEFKVQATNYTAEYGGHAGANVQVQLRSGSNAFHGAAFDYIRNDALDARNLFTPAPRPKPTLQRNQFGGTTGGPIRRNRTFFMGSYEGLREERENAAQANVLTAEMRRGDFSGVSGVTIRDPLTGLPFPNNIIPANRLDPLAVSIVNKYQPLPNQSGANNLTGVSRNEDRHDQFLTRIDHVLGATQKIFGHYIYNKRHNPSTPINTNFPVARDFNNHSAAIQHVTTWSSTVLNEIRFGYMRGDLNRLSPRRNSGFSVEGDLGIRGMKVGGPDGREPNELEIGFPAINIQGFNGFGDSVSGEGVDKSQTYQFVDTLTLIRGRHALKMGADIRRLLGDATSTNAPFGALDFTRDITGHAAAAFMMGYPRTARTPEGIPIGGIRQWRHGYFLQDDWRVNPRLTLNLGLRFDHNFVPVDINGVSRTLRFDLPGGPVLWPAPGEVIEDGLYVNKHRHWAPRLGFAYQLNERMVVRGGYGVFNMALHLDNINTLGTNPPTASVQVTNPTVNPLATLANPFPAALVPTNTIFNVTSAEVDRNHRDGYYQNWNVAVGYELSPAAVFEVRYVGAKGSNLDSSLTNFNSPDPDPTATSVNLQSRRPYPAFGRIRMWVTDGESNYHSMQSEFKHRGPWGLNLSVAYTLSRLRDNQQGGLNASRARRQNPRDDSSEWGPSADDIRNRVVAAYVWDIPFGSNLTGISGGVLKGWQLSGIATLSSGSPLFINQDGDTLNVDSEEIRPNLVSGLDPMLPRSERTLSRWFNTAAFTRATRTYGDSPRNPVVGPGLKLFDLSLAKSFRVRDGQQLQFRWEAFNAFNIPQWGNPNGTLGNSNFGVISSTRANNREMQLSLKYLF